MNPYIGHDSQLSGAELHRLVGGKGDGMRLLEIWNGKGLEMTVSPDRCADISRLRFKGINMSYLSACGYAAPAYYDRTGDRWLRTFTAGFLTTCGLENVGVPNTDEGVEYPLHGSIANQPCEAVYWTEDETAITVHAQIRDEAIFARKLRLQREIAVSKQENSFEIRDRVTNTGDTREAMMLLYHMNMGYPLLDEDSVLTIPSDTVTPRNAHAAEDLENWMRMQKPTPGYEERCYFHTFGGETGRASIFQPKLGVGLEIRFRTEELDCFTQWKMMGVRDYVLGLECANCDPDGRNAMRQSGKLKFLDPGESRQSCVTVRLFEQ